MKDYDAYLFDWDGTVAQTLEAWLPIARRTLYAYGIEADDKTIVRKVFGRAVYGLVELGVPEESLPAVFAEWDVTAVEQMPRVPFYPGIMEVFAALKKQGKHLAVITSTIGTTMETVFEAHKLHDSIDVLVTGNDVRAYKPDPEGINMALEQLHVASSRAIMFGDSEKDIRAAHNAGIDSVLFFPPEHTSFHSRKELAADKPTYIISSWQEVLDQVQ